MSTGERLVAAFVLDKPEWIREDGFTLIEAIDRLGPDVIRTLRQLRRQLDLESDAGRDPKP